MVPSNTALVNGATYYASQTINGCESVNRLAVTVSIVSALSVTDYNVEVCDEGNDGSEGINLANYNQYLTAPATGLTYNYYQNLTAAQNSDSSYEVTDDYMLQGNKVVYVQITSANGCSSIAALSLTLLQTPETTISDVLEICNEPLHVDAGMLFDDYLWSGGSTTTSIEITQPGNYWFTGTIYGVTTSCSITKNFQVISAEQPSIASIEVNQPANGNSMLIVHTTSMGNYQYSLDNVNYQNSNIFSNIKPGNYIVYVKNDCAIAVKMLTIPGFPAYFTPNGDGENDNWYVHYASKNAGFITSIYDRYGKLIANLKPGERWDGTFNGHNLPATDYWFTAIQNSDGYTHKGHFSLIR
jgi:gliding motility-associated-like protein